MREYKTYTCNYCFEKFDSETICLNHEINCFRNPIHLKFFDEDEDEVLSV